ncbi:MAG: SGNH/GDSL hydrolase family protein [Actinomycetota bacterium]
MHPAVAAAFEPPTPGRLLKATRFLPGVTRTAEQIDRFATYWRHLGVQALSADGPVLVALGDSLAQGIGASNPDGGYVGGLLRHLDDESTPSPTPSPVLVPSPVPSSALPVLNLSRSGATIADVLSIQLPALAAAEVAPLAVVCTVGSNDLVGSARLGRTRRALGQLVDAVPAGTVVAALPDRGSLAAKALNRHLRATAGSRGLVIAEVNDHLTTWRGHQAGDRFHPNDAGYRCWTAAFVAALARRPDGPTAPTGSTDPSGSVDWVTSPPTKGR